MTIALVVCFVAFAIPLDILCVWMKKRVNEELPEDLRLSWWSRNYRQVERLYGEQNPDSILPDLSRYGYYVALALMGVMVLLAVTSRGH
jgi:hypothetical protein